MHPQISIVVPVYNVAPYLEECLDSIVGQTLDADAYEVLLIDDKSTDTSLAICNAYAARHKNIRVFALPENTPGGAGFPSNVGIKNARGRYVGFVDSDDYAEPAMFAELLAAAEKADADITLCSYQRLLAEEDIIVPPDDEAIWPQLFEPAFAALPLVEQKRKILRLTPVPWRKLYRREFLSRHRILYPVGDFFYEDTPLHWFTTVLADSMACLDKRLVTHRVQRVGQTIGEGAERMALQMVEHLRTIQKFLADKNVYAAYAAPFWALVLIVVALVPPAHPLRPQITSAIIDICGAPPDGLLDDISWRGL